MSVERFVPEDVRALYAVHDWRNGLAVLSAANPDEWADMLAVLRGFRLHHTEIATPGGAKSLIANRLDGAFKQRGWSASASTPASPWTGWSIPPPPTRSTCSRAGWRWRWSGTTRTRSTTAT